MPVSGFGFWIGLGFRDSDFPHLVSLSLGQLQGAFGQLPGATCQEVDARLRGYHFEVTVAPEQVVAAAQIADQLGFSLDAITGVDWPATAQMEVAYDFFHPASPLHVVVRTRVPRDKPELPTIQHVFPGANWHERETHDFFGIKFLGHPDLSPLLLPEEADFHPLRKDHAGAA